MQRGGLRQEDQEPFRYDEPAPASTSADNTPGTAARVLLRARRPRPLDVLNVHPRKE